MNREMFMRDYWAYYLMLEEKFIHTTNYVTLSIDNDNAYSNEYAALMQMIGGELDSFFKVYCGYAPTDFKKISDYYMYLMQDYPDVLNQKINVRSACCLCHRRCCLRISCAVRHLSCMRP